MDGVLSTMSPCMLISSLFLLGISYGIVVVLSLEIEYKACEKRSRLSGCLL